MPLPDPRRYGNGAASDLARLADDDAPQLAGAVAAAVADARNGDIRAAYAAVTSRAAYQRLWDAVCDATQAVSEDAVVVTRVFAMPWLLVCGSRGRATLPCVLPDAGALTAALTEAGALGPNRNVGLSNALCDEASLAAIEPGTLRAWQESGELRDVPPAPITLAPGEESVHVRYLLGASVAPPHAPGVVETAANASLWARKATTAVASAIAMPGVDVLPVPRPPLGVMRALYAGRRAGLELAFQLFMSNTLRRFRLRVGDPELTLSAHEGGELRVTMHSLLDEGLTEGYRWPLHPLDDVAGIASTLVAFASECRVTRIEEIDAVLPDRTSTGALLFPRGAQAQRH
jgi:hypothetical protein